METTVTYDEKTKEFTVDSPSVLSQKYWISNGFKHANYSLVFGQTVAPASSLSWCSPQRSIQEAGAQNVVQEDIR